MYGSRSKMDSATESLMQAHEKDESARASLESLNTIDFANSTDLRPDFPSESAYLATSCSFHTSVFSGFLSRASISSESSIIIPHNSPNLTIFLLINTMIGSGILNQPYVFRESGILGGILGFAIAAFATWTGVVCLAEAAIHDNILEYSGIAKKAFDVNGERLMDITIIILTFGAQLGYILIIGTTSADLLQSWGCSEYFCTTLPLTIVLVGLFVTPTCLFRQFGHLAYLSIFSVAAIVAVLLLVYIGGPIKHELSGDSDEAYTTFNAVGMGKSLGSIVFALECASASLQAFISTDKKSQNAPAWSKITGSAVIVGALMCCSMGLVGYLSFGSSTQGVILDNFSSSGYDFFKVMVVTHLILYIPVNFVIMRYSVVKLMTGMRSETLSSSSHTTITICLLVVTTCTVLLLLETGMSSGAAFALILNITGGIGGSLSTLIMPAAIYLKLMPQTSPLILRARLLFALGVAVMATVVVLTILDFLG